MVDAVVVAAGQGTRLGFKKQFALLADVPMWVRSCQAMRDAGAGHIWVVVAPDDVKMVQGAVETLGWMSWCHVTAGGGTRAESVRNAVLEAIHKYSTELGAGDSLDQRWLAIHDAARPFVSVADTRAVIETAKTTGAAILAEPCVDTLKKVEDGRIIGTVPREDVYRAQTPQVFRVDWLHEAYQENGVLADAPTDEAALMERLGRSVSVVSATRVNVKVTTKADYEYAEWLALRMWGTDDANRTGV